MNSVEPVRKNILIVCSHFWPSRGGLESRMGQFSAELVRAGYSVVVLTTVFPGRTSDVHQGVRIVSVPGRDHSAAIRDAVCSGDYDVAILVQDPLGHIIWSVEGVVPHARTRLFIQPIINADGYGRWKDNPAFFQRLTGILKSADVVLTMTRSGPDSQYMASAGIDAVFLPNATVPVAPAGDFRREYGIAPDQFLVLHVANLYWVKNHVGLLDALPDLPASWRLVMIGHPSGEADCAEAVRARLAVRPDVLYIPGLSREWVSAAMAAADVVVLASHGEGSPNTILEAMSQHRPWLATPTCGAANDHVGGRICELSRFREYLAVLERNAVLRRELGELGHAHWEKSYSWPVVLQGWIDLVEHSRLERDFMPGAALIDETRKLETLMQQELAEARAFAPSASPLVSVVLQTCNRPGYLQRCLGSILSQEYPALEVVVVNNGGGPVESEVRQCDDSGRVHYISLAANRGTAVARNAGVRLARGKYVAFLDDDDEYLPGHVSGLVATLESEAGRFAYSRGEYLYETGPEGREEVIRRQAFPQEACSRDALMVANPIPTPAWLFERSLWDEAGPLDESCAVWEDWEWLIRVSACTDFLSVPRITVQVHQRAEDPAHPGGEHRPGMRKWFLAVYAKHPAPTEDLAALRRAHLARWFPEQGGTPDTPAATQDNLFRAAEAGRLEIIELINGANGLVNAGDAARGAALYRAWLEHTESPLRHVAAFNMGCALQQAGSDEEAEQAFRRCLDYNPDFPPARHALALELERRGETDEAISHWRWIAATANGVGHSHPRLYEIATAQLRNHGLGAPAAD